MSDPKRSEADRASKVDIGRSWVDLVRDQVGSIKFGTVLITVHDSRVVQVEKNEKLRLDHPIPGSRSGNTQA